MNKTIIITINNKDLLEVLTTPLYTVDDLLDKAKKIRFMKLDLPLDFEIVKGFPVKASDLFYGVLCNDMVAYFGCSYDDVLMFEKVLKRILKRKNMWQYVTDNWNIRKHIFSFIDKRQLVLNRDSS